MMIFKRKSEKLKSLSRLASVYGTDKVQHNYIPLYERHFGALRDRPLNSSRDRHRFRRFIADVA